MAFQGRLLMPSGGICPSKQVSIIIKIIRYITERFTKISTDQIGLVMGHARAENLAHARA